MQLYKISTSVDSLKCNSSKLIVFFAGWAMDAKPFSKLRHNNYDIAVIYDYNTFTFNNYTKYNGNNYIQYDSTDRFTQLLNNYTDIYIVAWSMGVWVASYCFNNLFNKQSVKGENILDDVYTKKIRRSVAINGTLCPISNTWGIPGDIFQGTIDNLPNGLDKFNLRMCGSKSLYLKYKENAPNRNAESIKNELISLRDNYSFCNNLRWDKAIISTKDNIFPPKNLSNFWEDYKMGTENKTCPLQVNNFTIEYIDQPHFPFFSSNFSFEEILTT